MLKKASLPHATGRTFDIQPDGREALQLSAALWMGATAFLVGGSIIVGHTRYAGEYVAVAISLATAVAIAGGLYLVLKRLAGRPRWMAFVAMPLAIAVAAALQCALDYGGYVLVRGVLPSTRLPAISPTSALMAFVINLCLYATNLALLWVTSANRALREQAIRLAKSESEALRAELQVLRLKLNPHFMFNALGAAAGLIGAGRPTESEAMLNRLSGFLRTTFDVGTDDIPLRDELSIIDDYLEVERVRFPDRMRVRFEVDETLGDVLVPSFLLQPLVENAVKYGVAPSAGLVTLTIRAARQDDRLILSVEENGQAVPSAAGSGLGQSVTRSRLAMRYGEAAHLTAGRDGDVYRALISLPLTFAKAQAATGQA